MTERAAALFSTLERQVQQGLEEVAYLRQQLEALEAENSRLRAALRQSDTALPPHAAPERSSERSGAPGAEEAMAAVSSPATVEASSPEAPSPQALLEQWYQRYPRTFFKEGHTRPLKVGIHAELVEREPWPDKLIRRALACYVNLPRYLKAVRAGVERVDLDGQPAGVINEEEARHARTKRDALQTQQRDKKHGRAQPSGPDSASLDRKLSELLAKHERL